MKTGDFFFSLPQELIAQTPLPRRDASRLLCLPIQNNPITHTTFDALPGFLQPGDCLVFNDSKVLPARLIGARPSGGAAEVLLLRQAEGDLWQALVRPGRKLPAGAEISFGGGKLRCRVEENGEDGTRFVRFFYQGIWHELLDALGEMPLPPYITEKLADPRRYQTVYAKNEGSAAAPTAGLHFTADLLAKMEQMGVSLAFVTLHVGLGTFRPVKTENIAKHTMHKEVFFVPPEAAATVNKAKAGGGRIIAIGTTSARVLESACQGGILREGGGETEIFIYPGYTFQCLDGLLTNFHLPESTLLMLVSALAGRERVLAAYAEAVEKRYRFFSFGDAMLLL